MKITSVTFRANGPAQGTPFSHVHVEATATIDRNETPAMALNDLKEWVHRELLKAQKYRKAIEEAITLDEKISRVSLELSELKALRGVRKGDDLGRVYGRPRG